MYLVTCTVVIGDIYGSFNVMYRVFGDMHSFVDMYDSLNTVYGVFGDMYSSCLCHAQ